MHTDLVLKALRGLANAAEPEDGASERDGDDRAAGVMQGASPGLDIARADTGRARGRAGVLRAGLPAGRLSAEPPRMIAAPMRGAAGSSLVQ